MPSTLRLRAFRQPATCSDGRTSGLLTDRTLARQGSQFDRLRYISPDSHFPSLVASYASTASEINSMNSWQMPTKISTGTNAERPLWIYLSRGGVSPTRIDVSINYACFAVFAGSIPVEVPLICAVVVFSPKLSSPP